MYFQTKLYVIFVPELRQAYTNHWYLLVQKQTSQCKLLKQEK